jgi:two-component system response regulator YesN
VKAGKNISDVFPDHFQPYAVLNHGSDEEQRRFIKMSYSRAFKYLMAHRETRASQIARDAKQCIDENYSKPEFNMNDLSKKLLVNQTYLRKMFKDEMGMTISEYLSKVRMDQASQLVIEGRYKLSAISEMVGYSDPGYFSKCFKNHFGVSPSEYQ